MRDILIFEVGRQTEDKYVTSRYDAASNTQSLTQFAAMEIGGTVAEIRSGVGNVAS